MSMLVPICNQHDSKIKIWRFDQHRGDPLTLNWRLRTCQWPEWRTDTHMMFVHCYRVFPIPSAMPHRNQRPQIYLNNNRPIWRCRHGRPTTRLLQCDRDLFPTWPARTLLLSGEQQISASHLRPHKRCNQSAVQCKWEEEKGEKTKIEIDLLNCRWLDFNFRYWTQTNTQCCQFFSRSFASPHTSINCSWVHVWRGYLHYAARTLDSRVHRSHELNASFSSADAFNEKGAPKMNRIPSQ